MSLCLTPHQHLDGLFRGYTRSYLRLISLIIMFGSQGVVEVFLGNLRFLFGLSSVSVSGVGILRCLIHEHS